MAKRRANGKGNIRKRGDGRWEGRYTAEYDPTTGKHIIKNVLGKPRPKSKSNWQKTSTPNPTSASPPLTTTN